MDFDRKGYQVFAYDTQVENWAKALYPHAVSILSDPKAREIWLRHGATWFAGVNILENDPLGAFRDVPPLLGRVIAFCRSLSPEFQFDKAQISTIYRGYPRQDPDVSISNHRFRLKRDAAHIDGLLRVGSQRFFREYHSFILGIPLNSAPRDAGPLVVWAGSHKIIQDWIKQRLPDLANLPNEDVAEDYQLVRRQIFETCKRVLLPVRIGEATLLHRFTLHGQAPWPESVDGPDIGRIIAYFRPDWCGSRRDWRDT